ncbi:MAG: acetyl-CoA carboxylase biotin carboxylase subunit [candidate division WOR-3 bacterium]|nr:acetyl-CoA carboxylase biotin carboxylase subunit [candidate division WOR-3 bacterium]MCX7947021.1 acetyl-CoA carboxylase biotin carboxylase subunit [candidate division WOR-3 bacterium]MDW8149938.1 acetyl-CoA carboxylase biotin carboxylase subunit [candidate division WOR-3 bacterium]
MIKKVLIANRGEIALRIARTLKRLSIPYCSIYSDADKNSLHVLLSDEAYYIGPPESIKSYLNMDKIIEIAIKSNSNAIHPGYGFLSENPEFAKKVKEAGLIFIGPSIESILLAGDKIMSKEIAKKVNVPILPSSPGINNFNDAEKYAREIGFPLMIKAAKGGGGKGMRIVYNKDELLEKYELASKEAESAFGDGTIYFEKYISKPRHIEVQIVADKYKNVLALGERECSIQRRHQKIIEESPSPYIDDRIREKLFESAINFARAINYENVGTVEFIFDENKNFYFLEMNTRLQVEHPITEWRYNIDLVEIQIKIANGEDISYLKNITPRGYSIEARIYAEDPMNGFIPSPGKIEFLIEPAGPYIRVDSGVYLGYEIPVYYDPMISKLIVYGNNRNEAISRIICALKEYRIFGVQTNIDYLIEIFSSEDFKSANYTTKFVEEFKYSQKKPTKILLDIANSINLNKKTIQQTQKTHSWKHKVSFWEI